MARRSFPNGGNGTRRERQLNNLGIKSVLFDFDYTLADSSKGAIECVNHSLKEMGFAEAAPDDIRATIGMSLKKTFETLTGRTIISEAEQFADLFALRADECMLDNTFLLEMVKPSLARLLNEGLSLAIVTSKFHRRIVAFLKREGLSDAFAVIVGFDDVSAPKPDPASLLLALERLGTIKRDAVYVGDSTVDAEAASLADVRFIAVLSGVTPREAFLPFECYAVVKDMREASDLICRDHA